MEDGPMIVSVLLAALFFAAAFAYSWHLVDARRDAVRRDAKWERGVEWGSGKVRVGVRRVYRWMGETVTLDWNEVGQVEMAPGQSQAFIEVMTKADQTARELNEFMEFGRKH